LGLLQVRLRPYPFGDQPETARIGDMCSAPPSWRERASWQSLGRQRFSVRALNSTSESGLTGEGLPGSVWLTWPTLTDYNATRQALLGRAAAVFGAVREGTLRPAIASSLPLTDAGRAHELLEAREVIGKILLEA
jgi:NADPH:quinone reductase-like Zn-dependent oxidoreductase